MTVDVFIWLPKGLSVGHASLELENGTYISLWPGDDKMGKTIKQFSIAKDKKKHFKVLCDNLDEDGYREQRPPDHVFSIEGLDETAIQRWWDNFNEQWNLLSQNCCGTVIDGLRAGGSDQRLIASGSSAMGGALIWTPTQVAEYCKRLSRSPSVPLDIMPGSNLYFINFPRTLILILTFIVLTYLLKVIV